MKLSIYDMDYTIIRKPSWMSWLFHYARTEAPARLLLAPLMLVPALGYALHLTDRKGLKQATQALMIGRRSPREKVERAADSFAAGFGADNELQGALAAIAADRTAGFEVAIATASCRHYVEALARRWGIDRIVATENRWEGDFLTPEIRGENCYDIGKLRMILASLDARPTHVKFSSDHVSDLIVLEWADEPVAANPSDALRQVAQLRGWPVCDWAKA
ncbi:HAD family hydrolase [Sandaracinobacteroides hominis]|uniref:HAD family hydrolase n=1 Tax=Sandaracinobacteroides hominis TaxID=2780086 RepID=UPI0018F62675|nr:HAD-IB family phosphatase [Sandaracinobacteroides hominis]